MRRLRPAIQVALQLFGCQIFRPGHVEFSSMSSGSRERSMFGVMQVFGIAGERAKVVLVEKVPVTASPSFEGLMQSGYAV